MMRISSFYHGFNRLMELSGRFGHFVETMVIPNAGAPKEMFYEPETNELRPNYQWYPELLRAMADQMANVAENGDSLLLELNGEE